MRSTTIFFLLSLAFLFGTSLATTDISQEAQLSKFLSSRALKRLRNRPTGNEPEEESDPWADPGTFAHLPERCKGPPSGSKEADRVLGLPGQPPRVNFRQYSGYVTVNEEHGRELFYYFVESPYDAESKPLILWLNGGPGCSSLGFGAMEELGPFRVNPDGTLRRNKHSWNNLANVIFLESPAGVGFSFSRNATDYDTVGDRRTAEDTYVFLVKWLQRFPEYKGRDFYISGESYGGHYVPQLATVIMSMNRFPGLLPRINLQGIFFGNPLLDDYLNGKGNLEFLWSHGVISDEVWRRILGNCTFTASDDWQCFVAAHSFQKGNIDRYNIYAPVCLQARNGTYYPSSHSLPGYDPCSNYYIEPYLNNHAVKQALHARLDTNWTGCNEDLAWNDAPVSMVPIIKRLVHNGLKVWIYSGDFDSICSLTATRFSVNDLNLTITQKWRPWYTPDSEVGGYVQQYQGGFTLASVRAAGHLVPTFQPKRSLVLLYAFLKNMLPPADIPN
ncbi:hypothetical protein SEVIR_2G244000v4 [Setaria viridis]|uniref:Carboxypeptidase n=2 Tax=Setaria TaxID=4554 RepID=K3ZZP3_SETIT|nr:hypothetical protein SETIT_2G234500v2 [Setaria italica]TKW33545.1 hypothetical protein SEVIR_2G244000v2 [Setaria viridis]